MKMAAIYNYLWEGALKVFKVVHTKERKITPKDLKNYSKPDWVRDVLLACFSFI